MVNRPEAGGLDVKYGFLLYILSQTAAVMGIIYGFTREKELVRFEDRLLAALRRDLRRRKNRRERRRIAKINARAVYRPMRLSEPNEETKAA